MPRTISSRALAVRLAAALAAIPALWACTAHNLVAPSERPHSVQNKTFPVGQNRDLDLLFMIDNSPSMKGLQAKLAQRMPDFMEVLKDLPGGLPNLHVAVISSALGTGAVTGVPLGCFPGSPGDDDGSFQHASTCTALGAGQTFIKAAPGANNFTGDIADVFRCIAQLGDKGCGIEQPFQAMRRALERAQNPNDLENSGFLRPEAILGIIMLTNEDDCSIPYESTLMDSNQRALQDELGGLDNYRCNEFGHLCGGQRPPHSVTQPTTLQDCVPAEDKGRLVPVNEFVKFVQGLKPNAPERLFVAALAGIPDSYVVEPVPQLLPNGITELQPAVRHSCIAPNSNEMDFADPGVRIASWVNAFPASNAKLASICEQDFKPAMEDIARTLRDALVRPPCLEHPVALTNDGHPNCQVALSAGAGKPFDRLVTECATGGATFPCWRLDEVAACASGPRLSVCWDAACDPTKAPASMERAQGSCAVGP